MLNLKMLKKIKSKVVCVPLFCYGRIALMSEGRPYEVTQYTYNSVNTPLSDPHRYPS